MLTSVKLADIETPHLPMKRGAVDPETAGRLRNVTVTGGENGAKLGFTLVCRLGRTRPAEMLWKIGNLDQAFVAESGSKG